MTYSRTLRDSRLPRLRGLDHRSAQGRLWHRALSTVVERLAIEDPMLWESSLHQIGMLTLELDRLSSAIEKEKKSGASEKILSPLHGRWRRTARMLRETESHLQELVGPPKVQPVADAWAAAQPALKKRS